MYDGKNHNGTKKFIFKKYLKLKIAIRLTAFPSFFSLAGEKGDFSCLDRRRRAFRVYDAWRWMSKDCEHQEPMLQVCQSPPLLSVRRPHRPTLQSHDARGGTTQ